MAHGLHDDFKMPVLGIVLIVWLGAPRRYCTGVVTGHWLIFFSLQGPILFLEDTLKEWGVRNGIRLPKFVSIPLTLYIFLRMADWGFFPPILEVTDIGKVAAIRVYENFSAVSPLTYLGI